MNRLLYIFLILACVSCNQSNNADTDSVNPVDPVETENLSKSENIKTQLREAGIYSYFESDTLHIYLNKDALIIKQYVQPLDNNPEFNKMLSETYRIEQSRISDHLYVSLYTEDTEPYKGYLTDIKNKKLLVENNGLQTYLGSSENGHYHAFETGTAACMRNFTIFDSENKVLKESSYYSCINDTNQLKWTGNKIYYYYDCLEGIDFPEELPELKEQEAYVQKYFWNNGNDSITYDINTAFME